ncbi:MAG: autotransporter-associated beta strand repeat-containing protein [Pseudomonadota bacterium]
MNTCLAGAFLCLAPGSVRADVVDQAQYDAALAAAATESAPSVITVNPSSLLVLQSGTASYPPGISSGLTVNYSRTTLDVGGSGASDAILTLGPQSSLTFTGAVTPPAPGRLAGFVRVGYGAPGTLQINGGTIALSAITGSSDPGRFIVGGGGGSGTSTVSMTDGLVTFANTGTNYTGFAVGRTPGPVGLFSQSGGTVRVTGTIAADIGTEGGTGTYALSGTAIFVKGESDPKGTHYIGSRPTASTTTAGAGTVHVSDAARYTFYSDNMYVGDALATGTIIQDGASSQVTLQAKDGVLFGSNINNRGGTNGGGTGSYQLSAGTLTFPGGSVTAVFGAAAGGRGTLEVSGGTLNVLGSTGMVFANATGATGTAVQTGGEVNSRISFGTGTGSYTLSGGTLNTAAGITGGSDDTFTFAGGTLNFQSGTTTSSGFLTTLSADTTIKVDGTSAAWNSALSGAVDLTKTGTGILSLGAANTSFSGDVLVSAGTLAVTNTSALSLANSVQVLEGATFDTSGLGTGALAIGVFEGAGALSLGTSALSVTIPTGETIAYSGAISAGYTSGSVYGRFTKTGLGTFVIDGARMADTASGTGEFYVTQGTLAQTSGASAIAYLDVGTGTTGGVANVGALSVSGGSLTVKRTLSVGGWGGSGSATQTGGTILIPDPESCTSCGGLYIGNQGGTGVYSLSGGTVDFSGGVLNLGRTNNRNASAFTGTLNVSDEGELIIRRGNLILGNWLVGASGGGSTTVGIGDGILNQSGGTIRVENSGTFYLSARGDGTYNLTGGVLEIGGSSLQTLYANAGGTSTFSLAGGTVRAHGTALTTSVAATLANGTNSTIDTNALGVTWSGALTGAGLLSKDGAGTLTLGNIASTGDLILLKGDVASTGATNSVALLAVGSGETHGLIIASGTQLTLTGVLETQAAALIQGGSSLNLSGGGTLKVGSQSFVIGYPQSGAASAGTVNISGATHLNLDAGATATTLYLGLGGGVAGVGGTLVQGDTSRVTLGTHLVIGADGAQATYTLNGSSTLASSAADIVIGRNTTQRTAGTSGTLTLDDSASLSVTGGRVLLAVADNGGAGGDFAGNGTIVQNGASSVALGGTNVSIGLDAGGTGTYQLNGGTLTISTTGDGGFMVGARSGATGVLEQTGGTLTASQSVAIGAAGSGTYAMSGGTASFGAGLRIGSTAGGTGTVTQTGGVVAVTGGSLQFGNGSGTYNLNGGTLAVTGSVLGATPGTDTLVFAGGGLRADGTVTAASSFGTTISTGATATFDSNGQAITWGSVLSGGGNLEKAGAGTLTLSAANSFTGTAEVSAGTLALTNATALSTANDVQVQSGATFDISGVPAGAPFGTYNVVSIGALAGAGTVNLGRNGLVSEIGTGETSHFSGTLVADQSSWQSSNLTNSLIKTGAGTLVIDGMSMTRGNLYGVSGTLSQTSGTTSLTYLAVGEQPGSNATLSITGGQISIGEALQIGDWGGTGAVEQSGGTLSLVATCASSSNCVAMNIGNQGGTGTYALSGGQLLISGGSHSIGRNAGAQPASSGTLNISGTALMEMSPSTSFGEGFLVIGGRDAGTQANSTGVLNQSGGTLRFVGASRLYLGGYGSGTYNFTGGTLEIGGNSLAGLYGGGGNTTGAYTFNLGGGTIKVIGTALTTSVNATLTADTVSTIDTNALNATWGGTLTGGGALAKTGAGTLTLSLANSHSGGTTLSGGRLVLGNRDALGSGALTFAQDASLATTGGFTLANAMAFATGATGTLDTGSFTVTLNGALSGAGRLEKTGSGTLTLMSANTYGGGTRLSGGTLAIGNANALGTGSLSVLADATLSLLGAFTLGAPLSLASATTTTLNTGAHAVTLTGAVTGAGGLTKSGNGQLTLAGTSSFSGPTSVTAGALAVTGALTGSSVTVGSGATLTGTGAISQGVAVQNGGVLSGASGAQFALGSLALSSGAIITTDLSTPSTTALFAVGGALTLDGTLNITGTDLEIGVYRLFSYGGTLTDNGLTIGTVPAGLDASGLLIAANNGRVDLVNTNGAVLQYWNGDATLGPGTGEVLGGSGTWSVTGANWTGASGTFNAPMAPQPGFAVFEGTAGTVTVDNSAGAVGATGLQFVTSGYVITGDPLALSGTQPVLRVGDSTGAGAAVSATISAPLTGSGGIEKTGRGTLTLSGTNLYQGTTLISAGTLALSGSGSIVASSGVVVTGTLDISATTGGATLETLSGTGSVALGARSVTLADASGTFSGAIGGTGGLTVQAGTLTLAGASSFSGATTIADGATLAMSGEGRLTGTARVAADGTWDVSATSLAPSVRSLAGAGDVVLGAQTLTLTQAADTFSGSVSGTGGLVLQSGTQTLSGGSSYSGGTDLSGGRLVVQHSGALGTGAVTFSTGATLALSGGLALSNALLFSPGMTGTVEAGSGGAALSGGLSGTGTLAKSGTGTLTLSGANAAFEGTVSATQGTLALAGTAPLGPESRVSLAAGTTLDMTAVTGAAGLSLGALSGAGTVQTGTRQLTLAGGSFAGAIAGQGGLTKTGAATLTLSGANSYDGATRIAGGALVAGANGVLSAGSATSVETGAILDLGGFTQTVSALTLAGGTLQNGALAGAITAQGGTIAGLGGTTTLTLASGETTLAGTSSFSGATQVSGGTFIVDGTLSQSAVTVQSGGTLAGTGAIAGAVAVNAGGALSAASGTTLSLGALTLDPGAILNAQLTSASSVPLFAVGGNLVLDGTLNITSPSLATGVSRLFTYGGTLTDNGLTFGSLPSDVVAADLSVIANSGRVDLINTTGVILQFWNGASVAGPGTGQVVGGSGTWSTTGGNWTDAAGSFNSPQQPQPGFAIFEGSAGTVTLDATAGALSATGLQFITSGYVLSGDALGLANASTTIRVGDGSPAGADTRATIGVALSGANGIEKTDLGTLILSGANTYLGPTLISQGTLALSGTGSIASSSGVIANGTFDISATQAGATIAALQGTGMLALGSQSLTLAQAEGLFSGTITGSGGLIVAGGTQSLSGVSSFSGGVTLAGGALEVGNAAALGSGTLRVVQDAALSFLAPLSLANAVSLGSGATARIDTGASQIGLAGAISGAGGFVKEGTGTLTLGGVNSFSGGTTLEGGRLVAGTTQALGTGTLAFAADATLAFGASGSFANAISIASATTATFDTAGQTATLSGPLSGDGSLAKTGTGTLTLAAPNSFAGGTTLSGGTLGLALAGALGTGALQVAADATLLFGSAQTFATPTGIGTGATATFDNGGFAVTFAGAISGAGAMNLAGAGTSTFSAANAYSGGTTLSGGTVRLQDAGALGTGGIGVAQSTRLVMGFSGPFSNALTLGSGASATVDSSLFDVRLTGGLSGAGGLTVTGGGNVTLAAPSSYSGATSVGSGTLRAQGAGAFSAASAFTLAPGATLDLGGIDQTLGSLAGAGTVQLGAGTLTTGADNSDTTFAGTIFGTGGLTKIGAGNFTLAARNNHSGDTNIFGGTVTVASDGALGTGYITIAGGALAFAGPYVLSNRVDVASGGAIETSDFPVTLTGDIEGSGSLTKTGTGTLLLSGNNTFTGGLIVEGGTLGASTPQALGAGSLAFQGPSTFLLPEAALGPVTNPVVLDAAVTLTPPAGGTANLSGTLSGAGGIATAGAGTVVLGAQNSYAGPTEVGAGSTLRTAAPGALPATTALTLAPGAQLDLAGNSQSVGSLAGSGSITLGSATLASGNNNADSVFTGTLSGSGTFSKVGSGKMVFDGTGNTGAATVSGGALIVGGEAGSSASFTSPVTVAAGGTIGGHGTVGPLTVEDGAALAPGNSIGTLTTVGALTMSPTSIFRVEVNATQSDVVNVIGTAHLAGTLQVDTSAGWTANYAYVFLTATGGVTGTFSDIVDDLPLSDVEIDYGANSVSLTLVASGLSFAALADTPNGATTADAAQSLGAGNPIYNAVLLLDAPAAQAAFSALSGGIYPSAASLYLLDSRFIRDATLARVRAPLLPQTAGAPRGADTFATAPNGSWAQAVGSWGTLEGDANTPSLSRTLAGLFAGMDGQIGEMMRLGFAMGYTQTSFSVSALSSSGSSDDYHVALYGGAGLGVLDVRAGAAFSWHDMTVDRTVAFPGFVDQLGAAPSAQTGQIYGEVALPLAFAQGALEPFATAAYVRGTLDGFTEVGGAAALTAQAQTSDVVFTTLGLRAASALSLPLPAQVRGLVGWQHAFGDLTPTTQYGFASGSLPFTVAGVGVPEDAVVLEAGLDFAFTPTATLGLAYSGLWGSSVSDNAFKGTLQIQF